MDVNSNEDSSICTCSSPIRSSSTAEKNASLYNEGKIEECAGLEEGERVQAEGGEENKAIQEDKSNKIVSLERLKHQRLLGHRHNLKSKFVSVDDFNPEALSAQSEEQERMRRLELQKSLVEEHSAGTSTSKEVYAGSEHDRIRPEEKEDILVVDLTSENDEESDEQFEAIVIGDEPPSPKRPHKAKAETVLGKYDLVEPCSDGRILVNANHPPNEPDVFLAPQIARVIKPHQIGGVRFLYDNIIESFSRYKSSDGFGCILAHYMGLGKTLQVIAFIDVYLRHTSAKHVLCVVPVNTLQNWISEFDMWLPISKSSGECGNEVVPRNFVLFTLNESVRSMDTRFEIINNWWKIGGVLLIGYEMYRLLALSVPCIGGNKMATKKKKQSTRVDCDSHLTIDLDETEKEMDALIEIQHALCRPGPDLVVCDEGHRIKNDATNLSQALKKLRTRRRIVLTGYPLQNNLLEYWCMVDFVRPSYLGTKHEFMDLFERPISNGQCVDSTQNDVKLMRYRSHVLHRLLEGFVLRRGHEILRMSLLPKFEHTILVQSSHSQRILYDFNMSEILKGAVNVNHGALRAFAVCSKIWNHPDIYYGVAKGGLSNASSQPSNSLADDNVSSSFSSSSALGRVHVEWPASVLSDYETGVLDNSPKMVVLVRLLEHSIANGDKVLIFSQTLSTLSYIECVLAKRRIPIPYTTTTDGSLKYSDFQWIKNKNYFRLDGSTSSVDREVLISRFNSVENNECWLFLLSTRAGSLGINLVGANRVIVVDVSWNPCHDSQAVCRIYRYGQPKPCHVYRLVCDGTMEKKIYDRQISKQGMAGRVIDEVQPERHFSASDIYTLLTPMDSFPLLHDCSSHVNDYLFDPVLMDLVRMYGHLLTMLPFKHESLLIDSEEQLTEVEKYVAVKNFQQQWIIMKRNMPTFVQQQHYQQQQERNQLQQKQQQCDLHVQGRMLVQKEATEKENEEIQVICLDSDSDSDEQSGSNIATSIAYNPPLTTVASHTPDILHPQNPKFFSSSVSFNSPTFTCCASSVTSHLPPLTYSLPSTSMLSTPTTFVKSLTSLQERHTPSEAAIAQALASVIQFQRTLVKDLNAQGSVGSGSGIHVTSSFTEQNRHPTSPVLENAETLACQQSIIPPAISSCHFPGSLSSTIPPVSSLSWPLSTVSPSTNSTKQCTDQKLD